MKTDWNSLAKIADAKFTLELQKLSALTQRIQSLNQREAALATLAERGRDELRTVHPSHFTNGDVLWHAWLGKTQRENKMEEARLRVRLESHRPKLQRAFGQKLVAEKLRDSET